ncbi:hypothetical protein [Rheinheimera fenheensis]|uniref:hypothetical protein n=1 Tax=Rheinheimera fenheensis TaxID=3152295 RepID=UPI00325DCC42
MLKLRLILSAVLLSLLSACTTYTSSVTNAVRQQYAVLQTETVTIVAEQENWQLRFGEPVMPPKVLDSTFIRHYADGYAYSQSGGGPLASAITPDYAAWMKLPGYSANTMNVKVYVEGRSQPLNGKMLFVSAREDMTESSAKRAWTVAVPQQYIQVAETGQVAVVYQPARLSSGDDIATWILWLSAMPLL